MSPQDSIAARQATAGVIGRRRSAPVSGNCDLLLLATAHDAYRALDLPAFGVPAVDTRNLLAERNALCYAA